MSYSLIFRSKYSTVIGDVASVSCLRGLIFHVWSGLLVAAIFKELLRTSKFNELHFKTSLLLERSVLHHKAWAFNHTSSQSVTSPIRTRIQHSVHTQGEDRTFPEFFDIDGSAHHEFVPPGQSVTSHFYLQVLQRLRDAVQKKRSDKWQGQWFLNHDNIPSRTSLVVQQFLSSPNRRTFRSSLRVTFGCSLLWKWTSRRHVSQPWRTSNWLPRPNSGRLKKNPSSSASNNGRIDGTIVCVCVCVCVCVRSRAQGSYFEGD
jgi:hypothetical protein